MQADVICLLDESQRAEADERAGAVRGDADAVATASELSAESGGEDKHVLSMN